MAMVKLTMGRPPRGTATTSSPFFSVHRSTRGNVRARAGGGAGGRIKSERPFQYTLSGPSIARACARAPVPACDTACGAADGGGADGVDPAAAVGEPEDRKSTRL